MKISITKLSQDSHQVGITRANGSEEFVILNSRAFLRHDLAHFAVESEVPIKQGYWGLVAAGASLAGERLAGKDIAGEGFAGKDLALAEKLAGPVQSLMRTGAVPAEYHLLLQRVLPQAASAELAARIHERTRRLAGHWQAVSFGAAMSLEWEH